MIKSRLGALFALLMCSGLFVFEWLLRTRLHMVHPIALLCAGAGVVMGLAGMIWPEKLKLTADNKLQPFAHKAAMAGMGLGGLFYLFLR